MAHLEGNRRRESVHHRDRHAIGRYIWRQLVKVPDILDIETIIQQTRRSTLKVEAIYSLHDDLVLGYCRIADHMIMIILEGRVVVSCTMWTASRPFRQYLSVILLPRCPPFQHTTTLLHRMWQVRSPWQWQA